jgi:hypothetical protein
VRRTLESRELAKLTDVYYAKLTVLQTVHAIWVVLRLILSIKFTEMQSES